MKDLDIYQFTLIKRVEEELEKLYLNVILKNSIAPALLSRTCSTDNSSHFSNFSVGFLTNDILALFLTTQMQTPAIILKLISN